MPEAPIIHEVQLDSMTPERRAEVLFSGKFKFNFNLSIWAREHQTEYGEAREIARLNNRVGQSQAEATAELKAKLYGEKNPTLSPRQIEAKAKYPTLADWKAVSGDTVQRWQKSDRNAYELFRLAGAMLGRLDKDLITKLDKESVQQAVNKTDDNGELFSLPEPIATKLNIDPKFRVNRAGLARAGQLYAQKCLEEAQVAQDDAPKS